LRVSSPGALSLNLGFTRYVMPPGGLLFIYSPDYSTVIGPFTEVDNEVHGQLWTPLVPGEEIVIEVRLPAGAESRLELGLTWVNHGYREVGSAQDKSGEKSGSCNVDVVCSQGDNWREEIRSVGRYTRSGIYLCTGALVNNTAQDRKPYFLTADHCGITDDNAPSVVVYWNYENSTCRTPGSPESGQPGDGQLNQSNTGAFLRADYSPSDMTLIELDDPINPAFNPYWAGWDRANTAPNSATTIHHPQGQEKRISFEYNPTTTTSWGGTIVPGDGTHIRVEDWDLGTTEGGSSGSPLFNPDRRIVGQLHGGSAACGNDLSDWYGRFYVSWNGGGANSTRLSNWLDPLNSGVTVLNGTSWSVGGIAELPVIARNPAEEAGAAAEGPGWLSRNLAALAGGLAGAVLAVAAGAWYARRRWLK
jgi:V8-like Glu-specific endopeptidase